MSLGGGGQKCKNCGKTAYAQEAISYDNQVYHKRCFRCTKCDSVVSLGKVAMIQGDLYCKPCFLKMFSEKGTYHVFGQKTLPKHMLSGLGAQGGSDSPRKSLDQPVPARTASGSQPTATSPPVATEPSPSPSPAATTSTSAPPSVSSPTPLASPEPAKVEKEAPKEDAKPTSPTLSLFKSNSSGPKLCVKDDCQNPRVAGKSMCEVHLSEKTSEYERKLGPGVEGILAAVKAKDIETVRELLHQYGPGICLVPSGGHKSAIQLAFGEDQACGEAMVEILNDYLKDLEADVAMLKDQMTPDKE